MHRLLVESAELLRAAPTLSREARNHLKVLRPKDGEEIELFDGRGSWRVCAADSHGLLVPRGAVCHVDRNPQEALTLFACVTKGSRWDWTVEKATELGVSRIVPVLSARTIVRIPAEERQAKRERWMRIAEEAARQSDAKWLPEICAPMTFSESLPMVRTCDCYVGALAKPPPRMLAEELFSRRVKAQNPPAVYVGPEGDFTPEELSALLRIATPVSFGPTVLRAETAAIYGVSVVKGCMGVVGSAV